MGGAGATALPRACSAGWNFVQATYFLFGIFDLIF